MNTVTILGSIVLAAAGWGDAEAAIASGEAAERGYRWLTTKTYLPADFDQAVFDELWKTWEEPLRTQAERATPAERRKMAFSRYGLTDRPDEPGTGTGLQYVDDGHGGWVMNCFACHGGKVAGRVIPGAPNSLYALETLTDEVRATKLRLGKPLTHMDLGGATMPLGRTIGTTNAVIFGIVLLTYRDADLNVHRDRLPPKLVHHDHDAPPWWNIKKKQFLYADGGVPKSHRALMQFLLLPKNGPEKFREWEDDYRDVLAWIESLEPPKYPFAVDGALAERGQRLFVEHCSKCHGTYGPQGSYPEVNVPIDEVDTDRARFDSIPVSWRDNYSATWFGHYGDKAVKRDLPGYVAPPLNGIWASPPYLHNGSVPTLWHVLHPDRRPTVWTRSEDGYDTERVGLEISELDEVPAAARRGAPRRRYFDTREFGKSAAGHLFPDVLDEDEKRAVLEYLKTL
jgi:mono/diheme cytochrome c family protein